MVFMEFIPPLEFSLLGGWIFLLGELLVSGLTLILVPKEIRQRLLDRSNFSKKQRIFLMMSKLFALINIILITMTPLSLNSVQFYFGMIIYAFGMVCLISAILSFIKTPLDEPVTKGLYGISRHPQEVMIAVTFFGICLLIGSGLAILILVIAKIFTHFCILAEEEACIKQYGESYKEYMKEVPRYFIFF